MHQFENMNDWKFDNPFDMNKHHVSYFIQEAYEYLYIYENALAQCKHSLHYELKQWIESSIVLKDNDIFTVLVRNALDTKQYWNDSYVGEMHHRPSLLLLRKDWMSEFGFDVIAMGKKPSAFRYNPLYDFEFEINDFTICTEECRIEPKKNTNHEIQYTRWGIEPRKIILHTNECNYSNQINIVRGRSRTYP